MEGGGKGSGVFLSPRTGTVNDSAERRTGRVDMWLSVYRGQTTQHPLQNEDPPQNEDPINFSCLPVTCITVLPCLACVSIKLFTSFHFSIKIYKFPCISIVFSLMCSTSQRITISTKTDGAAMTAPSWVMVRDESVPGAGPSPVP